MPCLDPEPVCSVAINHLKPSSHHRSSLLTCDTAPDDAEGGRTPLRRTGGFSSLGHVSSSGKFGSAALVAKVATSQRNPSGGTTYFGYL